MLFTQSGALLLMFVVFTAYVSRATGQQSLVTLANVWLWQPSPPRPQKSSHLFCHAADFEPAMARFNHDHDHWALGCPPPLLPNTPTPRRGKSFYPGSAFGGRFTEGGGSGIRYPTWLLRSSGKRKRG